MGAAARQIDESRLLLLKGLVRSLPASSLRSLDVALGLTNDEPLALVHAMISSELERRYIFEVVFQPFLRLFEPRSDGLKSVQFPHRFLLSLWNAIETREPDLYREAFGLVRGLRADDPTPVAFFRLVKTGIDLCQETPQTIAGSDDAAAAADVTELGRYLELHRIIRQTLARMSDFLGRIDAEKAAALRVMFKDAAELDASSGYRYLELVFANIDDASQIIKIMATLADRPKDRFLAESEMASFGERLLDQIEARVKELKLFMGNRHKPCEDLSQASAHIAQALGQLHAFEQYIELSRDGPWGKRVAAAHKEIAGMVEQVLNGAEKELLQVLPMRSERIHGRMKREVPDLDLTIDEARMTQVRHTLAFIRDARQVATAGGFTTLHTRIVQTLETRMDEWFGLLLSDANSGDLTDRDRANEAFERVTDLMGLLCGDEKAKTARRRVAASELFRSKPPVATGAA